MLVFVANKITVEMELLTKNRLTYERLSADHLSEIMHLEAISWPPELCATERNVLQRLAWQHVILGARKNDKLIGMAAWRYASFQPNKNLPASFNLFANAANEHSH